jgi:uncharacterized damage-inducible protein DinB
MNYNSIKYFHFNQWAHDKITNHLKGIPEETIRQPITSTFPSIFQTLVHVYIIDSGWHSVLTGEYASDDYNTIGKSVNRLISETKDLSVLEITARHVAVLGKLEEMFSTRDLRQVEVYASVPMSLEEVMVHIANHGTYHRGNISSMLHQVGLAGVPVDFGVFVAELSKQG